jgi:uncharacterized membrane protein
MVKPNHNPGAKRSTAAWRDKEIDVRDAFRAWMIMLFMIGGIIWLAFLYPIVVIALAAVLLVLVMANC